MGKIIHCNNYLRSDSAEDIYFMLAENDNYKKD